ncbi:MAG: apolipoprotein N-acyltransferase [Bacteroidota bacterium]
MKELFNFDRQKKYLLLLSLATAILLSLSFPPFPLGVLACVGFVPFLIVTHSIESFGRYFRYAYGTFFLFTMITLYWVGGFTHMKDPYLMIAGVALYLWEPLVLTLPALIFFFIRKRLNTKYSTAAFPFVWITMEWLYAYGELAFPWLHIGNSQTYQLEKIQFADVTGVYGISFWVLVINVIIYYLVKEIQANARSKKRYLLFVTAILVIYIAPNFYHGSNSMSDPPSGKSITIGILQPNIDPWTKWEGANTFSSRWSQVQHFLELIGKHINDSVDVVVLPESAILLNLPSQFQQMQEFRKIIDSLNVSVISGYVSVKYYEPENAPPTSSTFKGTNIRYDSFNSIMFVEPHNEKVQTYSKMRLVPFAERIPYADKVPFLIEPLRWGVGISNWGLSHDSTVFESFVLNAKFLAMVCYESIFPEFVSSFVDKGAEFLVFTTNDSWWGNTSGARQHNQFAVLRAVENRRWVVRCANGGISSFIDPFGNMYDMTNMYTEAYIQHSIQPMKTKSFYSTHGDWFARICSSITAIIFLFSIGYSFLRKEL